MTLGLCVVFVGVMGREGPRDTVVRDCGRRLANYSPTVGIPSIVALEPLGSNMAQELENTL
jgi:hypothetical protein